MAVFDRWNNHDGRQFREPKDNAIGWGRSMSPMCRVYSTLSPRDLIVAAPNSRAFLGKRSAISPCGHYFYQPWALDGYCARVRHPAPCIFDTEIWSAEYCQIVLHSRICFLPASGARAMEFLDPGVEHSPSGGYLSPSIAPTLAGIRSARALFLAPLLAIIRYSLQRTSSLAYDTSRAPLYPGGFIFRVSDLILSLGRSLTYDVHTFHAGGFLFSVTTILIVVCYHYWRILSHCIDCQEGAT